MTTEELRHLIAEGETLDVEFEGEERSRLGDRDLVEAVELCRISGPQAYRLLDRLVQQGLIERDSARRRGVGYRRPSE